MENQAPHPLSYARRSTSDSAQEQRRRAIAGGVIRVVFTIFCAAISGASLLLGLWQVINSRSLPEAIAWGHLFACLVALFSFLAVRSMREAIRFLRHPSRN